jgi:hypothetical protein
MQVRGRSIVAGALAAVGLGCAAPTEPPPLTGRYLLLSIDGRPLPAPWGSYDGAPLALSASIDVSGARPRRQEDVLRMSSRQQSSSGALLSRSTEHRYGWRGNQLFISSCARDSLCLAVVGGFLVGDLHGDSLVFAATSRFQPALLYRRAPPDT